MNKIFQKSIFNIEFSLSVQTQKKYETIQKVCLSTAAIIATAILAAWLIPAIRPLYPKHWDFMTPNTALCILATAFLLSKPKTLAKSPGQIFGLLLILLTTGGALYTHITGAYLTTIHNLLINQFFYSTAGLMSLQTALFFIFFALLLFLQKTKYSDSFQVSSIGEVFFSAFIFLLGSGYLFNALDLIGQTPRTVTSPHTLICMILLVITYFLWTLPNSLYALLFSNTETGKMIRSFLPWAVLIPYTILTFGYTAFSASLLHSNVAAAIVGSVTATSTSLIVMIFGYTIHSLNQQLSHLARHDPLTNSYNQRGFFEFGVKFGQSQYTKGLKVGIIYFDLDKLKETNDTYGHEAGSELICNFARVILDNIRKNDILGRLGGDEFALLIDETSIPHLLNRLETAFEEFNQAKTTPYSIFYSHGIAIGAVTNTDTLEHLLSESDQAMYKNKMSKR